ncbi:MAG: peptide deformylase [Amoebophilaceae bacterium]|jgi:peptide deformylase|nr:peptide deformylase [Amoebophilaceae bacterium]
MIYPIVAYGDPVLRQKTRDIEKGTVLQTLVEDMFATMDLARGVGLAAPQIGKNIRLFVVDLAQHVDKRSGGREYRKVLINPVIAVDKTIAPTIYEEGCLSLPNILVEVPRQERITICYFDVQWQLHEEEWAGFPARVMQHEYDHLEGRLHIDYASPLRKKLLKGKLRAISQGKVDVPYAMRFPASKKVGQ